GEAWQQRLGALILEADTVVFVLSPASAQSEICHWEVGEALRIGKRILPLLVRPLGDVSPPRQLQDINYIFFYADPKYPGSGFGVGLAALVAALNTDFAWIREHTRLMERATEWDEGHRPASRLLSGSDISEAKTWAARRPKGAPEPTALHLEFIRASEAEEASSTSAERKRLDEMAAALKERQEAVKVAQEETLARQREAQARARMRSFLSWGAAAVVLGLIGFTGYAYYLKGEAEQQRKEAQDNLHEAKLTQSRALVESARQAADL